MSVVVQTARIGYAVPDALDVTRKSGRGDGLAFAPSWAILRPALDARRRMESARRYAPLLDEEDQTADALESAGDEEAQAWAEYVPAYLAEMRASYRANRGAWERLLSRESVVLLCYCVDPEHCHRTLLARDILPKLGATYAGEVRREGAAVRGLW